ncbi:MAG: histone deacetylase family protein, partial [Deltaproteobacteria bacterium]
MTTALYTHPDCELHLTPQGHPERVARMVALREALAELDLDRRNCAMGREEDVLRCHDAAYLRSIQDAVPRDGITQLDEDTFLSPGSYAAAMRAVGGVTGAIDAVVAGEVQNAFVAVRPPGHHAERGKAMGFCLFGSVAIGAKYALDVLGLSRVAVVDFDVHHGNGTQDLLWDEARVRFVTIQQMPLWPGTGDPSEQGAHGQIANRGLPPGSDGAAMRAIYERDAFPWLEAYSPELIIVSAGFDAHIRDPLAQLEWMADDYAWLTERICDVCPRVVSVLEGGYDLRGLSEGVR